ncbi:MAG: hypothetical protein JO202_07200 [Ktedonobacteraceae bacterium]|nr:hypothetical protein [Ktedonobacteraceae bacterium]
MEISAFVALVVPFIIIVYLAVLLFLQAPRTVVLASLLGGLVTGLLNALFDLTAYYAHWWHYTLDGGIPLQLCLSDPCKHYTLGTLNAVILHLPLPFYITPILIYGSTVYLLIWRFWGSHRSHWLALLLLVGVPIFGALRDIYGSALTHTSYVTWDSIVAWPFDVLMWVVMFYSGFFVFRRLSASLPSFRTQNPA